MSKSVESVGRWGEVVMFGIGTTRESDSFRRQAVALVETKGTKDAA